MTDTRYTHVYTREEIDDWIRRNGLPGPIDDVERYRRTVWGLAQGKAREERIAARRASKTD